jgi:hypothetical protein
MQRVLIHALKGRNVTSQGDAGLSRSGLSRLPEFKIGAVFFNLRENRRPDRPNLTTVGMQEQLVGSGYCHNELRSASLLGFHADRALVPVNHDVVTDRQP